MNKGDKLDKLIVLKSHILSYKNSKSYNTSFIGCEQYVDLGNEFALKTLKQKQKGMINMDVNALEMNLKEQVEAGIMTQFELRRIMARATGGVYLDDEQKAQFEVAKGYVDLTVNTLHSLKVISDKRVNSTRSKLEKAIVKHIVAGGTLNTDGSPVLTTEGDE